MRIALRLEASQLDATEALLREAGVQDDGSWDKGRKKIPILDIIFKELDEKVNDIMDRQMDPEKPMTADERSFQSGMAAMARHVYLFPGMLMQAIHSTQHEVRRRKEARAKEEANAA